MAARAGPPKGPATIRKAPPTRSHRELRCAVIIALLVATPLAQAQAIAKSQGAGGNGYIKRLIDHLQMHCSLDDGPRNVKPRVYTDEVFEEALDVLTHCDDMTQAKLVKELQRRGVLPPGKHDAKYFFAQLKAHCQEYGLEARAGVTRAESFLCANDFSERLNFITRIKKQMKDKGYSLSDLVFMDETSVNATNHPKCEWEPCMQTQCPRHSAVTGHEH